MDWDRVKELLNYWLPALLFSLAVLAFSGDWGSSNNTVVLVRWLLFWVPGLTAEQINLVNGNLRKLGHLTAYGFLFFLWFRAFRGYLRPALKWSVLWALAVCLLVACLDEGHQSSYYSRSGAFRDVALDLVGALISAAIIATVLKLRSKPAGPRG